MGAQQWACRKKSHLACRSLAPEDLKVKSFQRTDLTRQHLGKERMFLHEAQRNEQNLPFQSESQGCSGISPTTLYSQYGALMKWDSGSVQISLQPRPRCRSMPTSDWELHNLGLEGSHPRIEADLRELLLCPLSEKDLTTG